jgi:hypothetical protein
MHSNVFTSTIAALTMAAALALSAPAFAASDSTTPAAQAPQAAAQNSTTAAPLTKQHVDGGDQLPDTKFTTQYERQPVPAYK